MVSFLFIDSKPISISTTELVVNFIYNEFQVIIANKWAGPEQLIISEAYSLCLWVQTYLKHLNAFAECAVPDPHCVVFTRTDQKEAVGRERNGLDPAFVTQQDKQTDGSAGIPQTNRFIPWPWSLQDTEDDTQ